MEFPVSAEGTRVAVEEHDSSIHLRHIVGDRLMLEPECGNAETFRRVIMQSDVMTISPRQWCGRCFPRMPRS